MAADSERNPEANPDERDAVGIEEARANFGALVIDASVANKRRVIKRHGKPVAAVVGLRDLERLRALDIEPAAVTE
jgi:prevent-host-death family protein